MTPQLMCTRIIFWHNTITILGIYLCYSFLWVDKFAATLMLLYIQGRGNDRQEKMHSVLFLFSYILSWKPPVGQESHYANLMRSKKCAVATGIILRIVFISLNTFLFFFYFVFLTGSFTNLRSSQAFTNNFCWHI